MAYKEPRVPQPRTGETPYAMYGRLTAFLRDFCIAAWNADRMKDKQIDQLKKRVEALEKAVTNNITP